jgi:SAM-dependent methyltransferase
MRIGPAHNGQLGESLPIPDLVCPRCTHSLLPDQTALICTNGGCGGQFPVVRRIPILIDDSRSVFRAESFLRDSDTFFQSAATPLRAKLRRIASSVLPDITLHLKAQKNYANLARHLLSDAARPRVLILGGSVLGPGMADFIEHPAIDFVESDVALGPRTQLVCDAHQIPFPPATFDGVVAQGVLEHVANASKCADEIRRVLKPRGLVYAETPFMQQGHFTPYDFTRFSLVGHRRLFAGFDQLDGGAALGPGMALAWAYKYFLLSFVKKGRAQSIVSVAAHLTGFWLKYFDYYLLDRPSAVEAASGFFFLGRRRNTVLSDTEILEEYRRTSAVGRS